MFLARLVFCALMTLSFVQIFEFFTISFKVVSKVPCGFFSESFLMQRRESCTAEALDYILLFKVATFYS